MCEMGALCCLTSLSAPIRILMLQICECVCLRACVLQSHLSDEFCCSFSVGWWVSYPSHSSSSLILSVSSETRTWRQLNWFVPQQEAPADSISADINTHTFPPAWENGNTHAHRVRWEHKIRVNLPIIYVNRKWHKHTLSSLLLLWIMSAAAVGDGRHFHSHSRTHPHTHILIHTALLLGLLQSLHIIAPSHSVCILLLFAAVKCGWMLPAVWEFPASHLRSLAQEELSSF